jgi:hypothetical protein
MNDGRQPTTKKLCQNFYCKSINYKDTLQNTRLIFRLENMANLSSHPQKQEAVQGQKEGWLFLNYLTTPFRGKKEL